MSTLLRRTADALTDASGTSAPAPASGGVVHRVLVEARRGASIPTIAARLGMPGDLVAAVVTELVAVGVVGQPTCGLGATCAVVETGDAPPSCAGCPLAR